MVLNAISSSPISPGPVSGMRAARSPSASRPATAAALRTGRTIARVRYQVKTLMRMADAPSPTDAPTTARSATSSEAFCRTMILESSTLS